MHRRADWLERFPPMGRRNRSYDGVIFHPQPWERPQDCEEVAKVAFVGMQAQHCD